MRNLLLRSLTPRRLHENSVVEIVLWMKLCLTAVAQVTRTTSTATTAWKPNWVSISAKLYEKRFAFGSCWWICLQREIRFWRGPFLDVQRSKNSEPSKSWCIPLQKPLRSHEPRLPAAQPSTQISRKSPSEVYCRYFWALFVQTVSAIIRKELNKWKHVEMTSFSWKLWGWMVD